MKAYVIPNEHARGLDAIELADMPTPAPASGHVLIKVHAVGLNPVDYKLAEGGNENWTYPHILGLDVAGEIVEIGEGVEDKWKVGMRVAGHGDLRFDGCFAEYVNAPAYELALIPDDVEYTTAAGLLCSALTAYQTRRCTASPCSPHAPRAMSTMCANTCNRTPSSTTARKTSMNVCAS